ncbi:MAG: condensation domain-containing protein [Edaphobacter sp.]|uniref:condensation domain-containing protein n=1 Tax=Edaphobacter sp. TaxID=1934404 RepID=UPI0023936432|nr:condensation domain-containing protein [Edaphobacter sp.]MDE1175178.1 condensation domain-containing protein [Edaphobacter sp.]
MREERPDRKWLELSLAQQSIWLESKLNPGAALQLGGWARIEGELDDHLARQAMSLVMARHNALRLRVDEHEPRQWIDESMEAPFVTSIVAASDDPDRAFQQYMTADFASPMPLGDHPLFCITLIRDSEGQFTFLLWRFHHLIADSVSASMTMRHWTEAYLSLSEDVPGTLAARSSYEEVIASDVKYLASDIYRADLDYWTRRFHPLPPVLIVERSTTDAVTHEHFYSDWMIEGQQWIDLNTLADTYSISSYRLLFVLFALVVSNRYGVTDLVAGIALHRREPSNWQSLGMFSGVLPVQFAFKGSESFAQTARRWGFQIDQDLRHQRFPVDHLARALGLFRAGRARLFDLVLSYIPSERIRNDSLDEGMPIRSGTVAATEASPISLHVTELPSEQMQVRVAVNPNIVHGSEANYLMSFLHEICKSVLHSPNTPAENLLSINGREHAIVVAGDCPEEDRQEWVI